MASTFGERLQQALTAAGKSRAELAKVLRRPDGEFGISVSAVGQAINGDTKSMSAENTVRAARFLEVDGFWLATGERHANARPHIYAVPTTAPSSALALSDSQAPFWTDRDVLERLAMLLARVPASVRPAFGDIVGRWAADGGTPDRTEALLTLMLPSGKRSAPG